MKCDRLFSEIDALQTQYFAIWADVCNLESPTADKKGVDAVGRYFVEFAEKRGWKCEIFPQAVSGDVVCITMNPDATGQPIALSGHTDTVHPVGSFGSPAVRMDEEKIYGPGVIDCKGGIVAALMAMDALDRVGFRDRPVMLLLQSDEEVGSRFSQLATIHYICEKAKDAVAFLNLEGYANGKACLSRKGIARYEFTVTGIETHSCRCAFDGANAIAEAAHKILALEKMKDANGLTCNCGLIQGGTAANTVPRTCTFSADIRFSTVEEQQLADRRVHEIAETTNIPGCTCTVELKGSRIAMALTQTNIDLLDAMNRIFDENGLQTLTAVKNLGGSDAAYVTEYGIPCVDSFGVEGGALHSLQEFAWLASLANTAKRCAAVAYCL